jgi:hypothetical protein
MEYTIGVQKGALTKLEKGLEEKERTVRLLTIHFLFIIY